MRSRLLPAAKNALDLLHKQTFDVVLLDIWLPGIDGLETLDKIRGLSDAPEVIMISGHGTIETAVRATKLGAYDFLEKPLSIDKTLILLKNALDAKRLPGESRSAQTVSAAQRDRWGKHSDEGATPADQHHGAD